VTNDIMNNNGNQTVLNCYPLAYLFNEAKQERWWKDSVIGPKTFFCKRYTFLLAPFSYTFTL